MIWARIRFTIKLEGNYAEAELGFPTDDMPEAAMQAALLCTGYQIASGMKAGIIQVAGHPSGGTFTKSYKMPKDWVEVHQFLEALK